MAALYFLKFRFIKTISTIQTKCYHCGENCDDKSIAIEEKNFCCQGCKQVFLLLSQNDLCVYYNFDKNPGIKAKRSLTNLPFAFMPGFLSKS